MKKTTYTLTVLFPEGMEEACNKFHNRVLVPGARAGESASSTQGKLIFETPHLARVNDAFKALKDQLPEAVPGPLDNYITETTPL